MSADMQGEVAKSIARILADKPVMGDGKALKTYLRSVLHSVCPPGARGGALRQNEGRRSFAAEILNIGLRSNDGSDADDADDAAFRRNGQPAARGWRGAKRRLGPGEPDKPVTA